MEDGEDSLLVPSSILHLPSSPLPALARRHADQRLTQSRIGFDFVFRTGAHPGGVRAGFDTGPGAFEPLLQRVLGF